MKIQRATKNDIEILLTLRMEVLKEANEIGEDVELRDVERQCRRFFLTDKEVNLTVLGYDDAAVVACGSVCLMNLMPTWDNPSGRFAYIMNMYTRPMFRRNGYGLKILDYLLAYSQKLDYRYFQLEATKNGAYIYEKRGFKYKKHEMSMIINDSENE